MGKVTVVVNQANVIVEPENTNVNVFRYSGENVYPNIYAQSPIVYNSNTRTISINQPAISIQRGQVGGLGTAASRDVPSSGNATSTQIVLGSDSRLSVMNHMPFGIVTDVSGQYLVSMGSGIVNQIIPEGRLFFVPMFMSDSAACDRIAVEVASSASANGLIRLGVYESNSKGLPGNLLIDAGTVNGNIVGVKQTIISNTFEGLVWIAVVAQNGVVSLKSFTNTMQAYPSATTGATSAGKLALSGGDGFYGTLPTTATSSPTGVTYYPPLVNLRLL
jgi:hypothetical protein